VEQLREGLIHLKEFSPFNHFLHVAQLGGKDRNGIDLNALVALLPEKGEDEEVFTLLSQTLGCYDMDGDGQWAYSEYLRFIYAST